MKRKLTAGLTGISLPLFVFDTSSTTGAGLANLNINSSGLVCEYRRQGVSSWVTIILSAGTLGNWTSGGFSTDGALSGAYELGLPDAITATGARWVAIRLYGVSNMVPCLIEIELDAVNYQDSQRFGLNVLPASGILAINPSLASLQTFSTTGAVGSITGAVTVATNNDKTGYNVTTVSDKTGYVLAASQAFSTTGAVNSVVTPVTISGKPAVTLAASDVTGNLPAIVNTYSLGKDPETMVWEANLNNHVNGSTFGLIQRPLYSAQAVAGSGSSIILDSGASGLDGFYNGHILVTFTNPGYGQARTITQYNGTTKAATVYPAWTSSPGSNTNFAIYPANTNFPTNFSAMAITNSGALTAGTVGDKTGYIASTVLDKTGYSLAGLQSYSTTGSVGSVTAAVTLSGKPAVSLASADVTGNLPAIVNGYAPGQDPGTYVLVTPSNKLGIDSLNRVVAASVSNGVTVATNNDKLGYSVNTVNDKTGYILAESQIFSTSGSIANVTTVLAPVIVGTNQDKNGYRLSSSGFDSIQIETGINARQALALTMDAVGSGVISGAATSTITVWNPINSESRIVATVDSDGNRSQIKLSPPV